MAYSLNKVQLLGNLGADPEVRHTQDGRPVVNLRMATSETWKDNQGERQERTEWHRVVIFGKLAEIAQQYLRKGSKVYVEGQLQTRKWTDNQGQERFNTEVVLNPFSSQMIILDQRAQQQAGAGYAESPSYGEYRSAPAPAPAPAAPASRPAVAPAPSPYDDFAQGPSLADDMPF